MKQATKIVVMIITIIISLLISCKQGQPLVTQDQNRQQPVPVANQVVEEPKPAEITATKEPLTVIENRTTEKKKTVVNVKKPDPYKEEPAPETHQFAIVADEKKFNPDTITVKKGEIVQITFNFNDDDIYYGGLDIKSQYFNTAYQKADKTKTKNVEFTAEKSFNYIGYWPATSAKKAVGHVIVEELSK